MSALEQIRPPGGWGSYEGSAPSPTALGTPTRNPEPDRAGHPDPRPHPNPRPYHSWLDVDIARLAATQPQPGWDLYAACKGADPALFFPERGDPTADAKAVCARCPVRYACLADHLARTDNSYDYGIWGGTSARDRRRIIRPALERHRASARLSHAPDISPTDDTTRRAS